MYVDVPVADCKEDMAILRDGVDGIAFTPSDPPWGTATVTYTSDRTGEVALARFHDFTGRVLLNDDGVAELLVNCNAGEKTEHEGEKYSVHSYRFWVFLP